MEFVIAFADAGGTADVEIAVTGVPTAGEFAKLNEELLGDPHFRAGLKMLVDCSALDTAPLDAEDVQRLTEPMVMRDWHYPPLAVALVAPDDRTFDVARAYRAHLGGSRSSRQVFRSRAEAEAWLAEQE
ncbi:MAG TPA: hypothetical protein VGH82_00490 [Gaiellaceae bacterium]